MGIINQLRQISKHSPDQILFEENDQTITALQLYRSSSNLAFHLQNLGVESGDNICILLPRGIPATIAIYAIIMSGSCYIPIDIQSPTARQSFIIKDSKCAIVIGYGESPAWICELDLKYINLQKLIPIPKQSISMRHDKPEMIAAILYTSGSTGTPKGVTISEASILAFSQWAQQTFSLKQNDRIANLAPFHFDLSIFDLFAGPMIGATTVYIPDALKLSPAKMVNWLITNSITSWYTVPSILSFLILKGGLTEKRLPNLRQILFAGEVFATAKLIRLMKLLPDTKFYNLFGPTETNVCLYWPVSCAILDKEKPIPAGMPACEAQIRIAPENEELLVKGPCLMSGYWNNGKISLPLDSDGWFHTGDKVSKNVQGEYEYHGRLDRMVKNAGYRIEPAEIEMALNSIEGVRSAAIVSTDDPISGSKIVAVMEVAQINRKIVQKELSKKLPAYMLPRLYLFIKDMPILSNGKIDYQKITKLIQAQKANEPIHPS